MQGELSLLLWMGYEWLKRLDGSTDHNIEDKRILSTSIDIRIHIRQRKKQKEDWRNGYERFHERRAEM